MLVLLKSKRQCCIGSDVETFQRRLVFTLNKSSPLDVIIIDALCSLASVSNQSKKDVSLCRGQ